MTSLDLDAYWPPVAPDDMAVERKPKRCPHIKTWRTFHPNAEQVPGTPLQGHQDCGQCGKCLDPVQARRGKQSRNYGNRAELAVARTYGGEKIGHAGGPVDVRGVDWNTQVKTHRRRPPREWTSAFQAMSANRERMPRLLLRFVMGPGIPPDDYFVVRGSDWLAWHGKDEETR